MQTEVTIADGAPSDTFALVQACVDELGALLCEWVTLVTYDSAFNWMAKTSSITAQTQSQSLGDIAALVPRWNAIGGEVARNCLEHSARIWNEAERTVMETICAACIESEELLTGRGRIQRGLANKPPYL